MSQTRVILANHKKITWLEAARKKEIEKLEKCPIYSDCMPGYVAAQGWGYVVAGYFLIEQSLKALIHAQTDEAPETTHSLTDLFEKLEDQDKSILGEYYDDFRLHIGGKQGDFPFETLDEFLLELDGGNYSKEGSLWWRYYLIEEHNGGELPDLSLEYLYEIVRGCIQIIRWVEYKRYEPLQFTYSKMMQREREMKLHGYLTKRMNSEDWRKLGERLETLWGPDQSQRYFYLVFDNENSVKSEFSKLPKKCKLQIIDKTKDFEDWCNT